jgi:hypothetical protein
MINLIEKTFGFSIFLGLQTLFYHHIYEEVKKDQANKKYTIYQEYWECMQKYKNMDNCQDEWKKIILLSDLPK